MSHKEQYDLIVSFKSKTTAELHTILMSTFDMVEKKLGDIQFTKEATIQSTYEEFEKTIAPLIQYIWRLQHILSVREHNESKRMMYERNVSKMIPAHVLRNEYNTIMEKYYSERLKEIKDITQIKHQNGDSNVAAQYINKKIEMEEETERLFLNSLLLRYVTDIDVMRAAVNMTDNFSSNMY